MVKTGRATVLENARQDRVFQLSLTEIAFIIAFLVMFLLGWIVVRDEAGKKDLLGRVEAMEEAEATLAAAGKATADLAAQFAKSGAADPDALVSELVAREKLARGREVLRQRVDQLEQAVSALTELKAHAGHAAEGFSGQQIADALAVAALFKQHLGDRAGAKAAQGERDQRSGRDDIAAAAKSALALKSAVEAQLDGQIPQGQEARLAAELVAAARRLSPADGKSAVQAFARENRDLRGQVAFLKTKLEGKGGRDHPPCWADESTGRVQYLFAIDITDRGLIVRPAWPEARKIDAQALPGMDALANAQSALNLREFRVAMQGIDELSRKRHCRHYVVMRNHVADLAVFNSYRFAIEHYFYKLETQS
jgi:hypothetical protein